MKRKIKHLIENTANPELKNLRIILVNAHKKVVKQKLVDLLNKFGVSKLSDLPEDKYEAFRKELVKLLN